MSERAPRSTPRAQARALARLQARAEALAVLGLTAMPCTRQELHGAVQAGNPQLEGWGDRELEAYRQLWQVLPPAGERLLQDAEATKGGQRVA
jgi:hypothetical protein